MAANFAIEIVEDTALLRLDDGKVNVIGPGLAEAATSELSELEHHIDALIITGNPKAFCSGYDLKIIQGGAADTRLQMIIETWRMWLQLYCFRRPVVTAVSGHALGMGAYLALSGDRIFSAEGEYGMGFTEVAVGAALNSDPFIQPIARRVPANHIEAVVLHANRYSPKEAVNVGLCDKIIQRDQLIEASLEYGRKLAKLPPEAFSLTKRALRRQCAESIQNALSYWQEHGSPPTHINH